MSFTLEKDGIFENFGGYAPAEPGQVDPDDADRFVGQQIRLQAMSTVLAWTDSWDHGFKNMESILLGIADMDGDEEISKDEEDFYNDLLQGVSEAMLSLGADRGLIDEFLNNESKIAGDKLGDFLSDRLNAEQVREEQLIVNHALVSPMVLESTETIVRGGQVLIRKKRVRKRRLTSIQKAASKKNLRKAHSGLAKERRERSLRLGRKRGLYDKK